MEQEPPVNQQQVQTFRDLIMGDGNIVTITQTQIIQISVESVQTRPLIISSPYIGLKPFEYGEQEFFFGREQLIAWLIGAIANKNLILLLGASGSGKSSVVGAGLIPQLRSSLGAKLRHFTLKPDKDPFDSLRSSLVSGGYSQESAEIARSGKSDTLTEVVKALKKSEEQWLIFVDQFEQLFTCPEEKCNSFIESLVSLANSKDDSVKIILTMRSDFLGNLSLYPQLWKIVREKTELVTEMQDDELRLAIEQPAAKNGVVFEKGLVEDIIKDVRGQAGSLPLLQYTLNLLWEQEDITGRTLHTSKYRQLGGVRGALQKRVSEIYTAFTEAEKVAVKQIFLKLVDIGQSVKDAVAVDTVVSRRAYLSEFIDDTVKGILKKLIDEHKLLISDDRERRQQPTVELAHESLINSWKELKEWIEDSKEALIIRNRLADDARRWKNQRQDNKSKAEDELWSGSRLERVLELRQEKLFEQKLFNGLSDDENKFIDASVELRDRVQAEKVRLQRRAISWLSGGLTIALIAAGLATWQWQRAERQRLKAEIEGLGVIALRQFESGGGEIEALLLAMQAGQQLKTVVRDSQALQDYPSTMPLYALQTILSNIREQNQFRSPFGQIGSVSFNHDGKLLATAQEGGFIGLWKVTGQPIARWNAHQGNVNDVVFSPDDQKIATAGNDGTARLWDLSGKKITEFKHSSFRSWEPSVGGISFSPDGKYLATASTNAQARLWTFSGKQVNVWGSESYLGSSVWSISFSPKGQLIATAENLIPKNSQNIGAIRFWDFSGKPISKFNIPTAMLIAQLSFSPDGKRIAAVGSDTKQAILWDLSGKPIARFDNPQHQVRRLSFNPDGQNLATAGEEGVVKLWDLSGQLITQFYGHQGPVYGVSFSPDGKRLATAGADSTVRLWNLWVPPRQQLTQLRGHQGRLISLRFSPDGQRIVTAGSKADDLTVRLWNLSGRQIGQFNGEQLKFTPAPPSLERQFTIVMPSLDGNKIFTIGFDHTARLWDLAGKPIAELKVDGSLEKKFSITEIISLSFSPDGQQVATVGLDMKAQLWNFSKKQVTQLKGQQEKVKVVSISPDGKRLATVGFDGTAQLWDISGQPLTRLKKITPFSEKFEEVSGIGIRFELNQETKNLLVTEVIENSPAQKAGVEKGDRILTIDGKSTKGMNHDESGNLIGGKVGTQVKLRISRQGRGDFETPPITRSKVKFPNKQSVEVWENVYFSPDGKYIATSGSVVTQGVLRHIVQLWNLSGKPIAQLSGHQGKVINVSFSHDGKRIGTVGLDNTIRLWDLSGKQMTELRGHQGAVLSISFSSDGQQVATAGEDRTVRLWSLSGEQIAKFHGHQSRITNVIFSPDGKHLATASEDGVVILHRVERLDELLAQGCNWLQDYFTSHPDEQKKLKVCQDKSVLIEAGRHLARSGDFEGAVIKFQKAEKLNSKLNLDPKTEAGRLAAVALVNEGANLAQLGDVEGAVTKFRKALKLDPKLDLNPETEAGRLAVPVQLIAKGEKLAKQGKVKEALAAYAEAQKLAPTLKISADSWNALCWFGSLHGYAKDVIFACEKEVTLEPGNGEFRDSRGLARALTGDSQGAIEDFQAYVDWISNNIQAMPNDKKAKLSEIKARRQRWIDALRAGKNPFTPEEKKRLLNESPSL
jgi:WD40 repeat protein